MSKVSGYVRSRLGTKEVLIMTALALSQAMAVVKSVETGLFMGFLFMGVCILSGILDVVLEIFIPKKVCEFAGMMADALLFTCIWLTVQAYSPGMGDTFGIYIPLLMFSCIALKRTKGHPEQNRKKHLGLALLDGIMYGITVTVSLLAAGILRETMAVFSIRTTGAGALILLAFGTALVKKVSKKEERL